jgi:hypothetical protein
LSALYIRRKVRTWATALPNSTYAEGLNVEEDISGIDIALLADFIADGVERATFCGDEIETGIITLSWVGRAGIGDEALLTAVEADVAVFYAHKDPKLTLMNRGAPETFASAAGQSPRFICDVEFEYQYVP